MDDYLDGYPNAGVYLSFNLNFYTYTYQNPVKYIDPNGTDAGIPRESGDEAGSSPPWTMYAQNKHYSNRAFVNMIESRSLPVSTMEEIHEGLDLLGLVPFGGNVADGFNIILYSTEGDWKNASISLAGFFPLGQAVTGVRIYVRIAVAFGKYSSKIKWVKFAKGSLKKHFQKHGNEFGKITQKQYEKKAKEFAKETGSHIKEAKVGKNTIVKYDPKTGRVLVGHAGRKEILTFYIARPGTVDPFKEAVNFAKRKIKKAIRKEQGAKHINKVIKKNK